MSRVFRVLYMVVSVLVVYNAYFILHEGIVWTNFVCLQSLLLKIRTKLERELCETCWGKRKGRYTLSMNLSARGRSFAKTSSTPIHKGGR
jgi:hypothetical protein